MRYRCLIEQHALAQLESLNEVQRQRVSKLIAMLRENPFLDRAISEIDETGQLIEGYIMRDIAVMASVDHAVKEVKV